MKRAAFAILFALAAVTGCGGDSDEATRTQTTSAQERACTRAVEQGSGSCFHEESGITYRLATHPDPLRLSDVQVAIEDIRIRTDGEVARVSFRVRVKNVGDVADSFNSAQLALHVAGKTYTVEDDTTPASDIQPGLSQQHKVTFTIPSSLASKVRDKDTYLIVTGFGITQRGGGRLAVRLGADAPEEAGYLILGR
jgi:hypothetical protein